MAVYQRQVAPTLALRRNDAYRDGIALLRKIRGPMNRLGRGDGFKPYLETVRAGHQRTRNFIRMRDRAKWP